MTIIVHHLENSRSQRILWMLEEAELAYRVERYERMDNMRAPDALRRVHPLGKSPMIEDDGQIILESGAIVEYLNDKAAGKFAPEPASKDALLCRQYIHYAEGSMMPPLLAMLVVNKMGILGWPARKAVRGLIEGHLVWLNDEMASRDFFVGTDLSIADIMMSFPLEAARSRGGLDERFPNLQRWLDRIQARPAYKAALEAGGPYAFG